MKNKVLFIALLTIAFTSCIPSLHPIFTEQNRIVDDKIIGTWISESFIKENNKINLKIESTDDVKIDKSELFGDIFNKDEKITYQFERATTITYLKKGEGKSSSKVKLQNQRASQPKQKLLEQGYEVVTVEQQPYYILTYTESAEEEVKEEVLITNLTKIGDNLYMDFKPIGEIEAPSPFGMNWVPAHTFAKASFENGKLNLQSFDVDYIESLLKGKRVRLKHETIEGDIVLTASTKDLRSFILKYGNDQKLFNEGDLLQSI